MSHETMNQEIEELEEQGWEADAAPRAVEKLYRFPDYPSTMDFLVAVGKAVAAAPAPMPSIRIEAGTEVHVRVGGPTVRTVTAEEIALAKALPSV